MLQDLPGKNIELDTLLKKCIAGERIAQAALYNLFAPTMLTVCFRYSKTMEDAEDTLQEGFIKVFENIKKFRNEGSLEGWIRRIMVNAAIQKYRKLKTTELAVRTVEYDEANLDHHADNDILGNIGAKELLGMIQRLSPGYQMVFNLYVFEGMKHKEIAQQLGISEGTSKSNLSDARNILQRELNKSEKHLRVKSNG